MSTESALSWLAAASAVIWLGIGCYVAFLAATQRGISARLKSMEQRDNDR